MTAWVRRHLREVADPSLAAARRLRDTLLAIEDMYRAASARQAELATFDASIRFELLKHCPNGAD